MKRVVFTALFYYNDYKFSDVEVAKLKKNNHSEKHKQAVKNKKHQNNKKLKAKEIIAKNRIAIEKEHEKKQEETQQSLSRRILHIVKKLLLGLLIVVFAIALISFVVVRIHGGTPEVFGYSVQRVVSGSMVPTLQVGDIILSKHVTEPSEIDVDDIVTFQGDSEFEYNKVTHRVIAPPMINIDGDYVLTTKGDANERADHEISFSTVESKLITKIVFLNKFYEFFMSPWGLIIFIAALLIIFFDELLTVVKVLTGNYVEEEDENVGEIMERLKREEFEKEVAIAVKKAKRLKKPKKYDNTSKKKIKNRKKKK